MLATIQTLREITQRCRAQVPLTPQQLDWLGGSLRDFLDRRHRTIEEAMGLRFPRGGVPWWLEEGMRVRDAELRELARRFLAGLSLTARARRVAQLARRYAAAAWLRDRGGDEMPARYRDAPEAHLFRAFKSGAAMPIGERQLRSLLAH